MLLTDSHCHIDFDNFSNELASLLEQCYLQGIHRIIVPSIAPKNWQKVLELSTYNKVIPSCSNKNNNQQSHGASCQLFPCLGIHPWFLNDLDESVLAQLTSLVAKYADNIVAIGEAGIDKVIAQNNNNLDKQITFFEHQLSLSNQYNLPIIVHHRRSHDIIIPILKKHKPQACGVIHAFSGSYQQAKAYIDLGFKLGIGGTLTYERAQKTIKAIKKLPLESLLLETDAPSMPLQGHQGEDNSPLRLIDILKCLAEIRCESVDKIAQAIEINIDNLFFSRRSEALAAKTIQTSSQ
ncbi:TatD family hydrolase [Pseudocolwellia agarivorans]|uniref:TatD family hydrolase n=1 Tax=Pseudocolwellia agarivorans TaxID=1911682 RepID=UPI0009851F39|nr:TatD family hydrolase [Pseudocolwellia agarivorans]